MGENVDISALRIRRDANSPAKSSRRNRGWIIIAVFLVLASLAGYIFVVTGAADPEIGVSIVSRSGNNRAQSMLTASGYVVAQREAAVASKGTGRLVYLGVEEGDRVTQGQIIARLEDSDVLASLGSARANLAVVRADSSEATANLKRQQALKDQNLTSQANLDAAKTAYQKVIANIGLAAASIREAEVAVENTVIRAPFNGTVLTKNADVGEIVAPFAASTNSRGAMVTTAPREFVEADVSESNITLVKLSQPCEIMLDAYPDQRYRGYVKKIVPTADRSKATVMVKVAFDSLDGKVLPEMSTKVQFLSEARPANEYSDARMLTIPTSSILQRDRRTYVLLINSGVIEERDVKLGQPLHDRTVVRDGLQQGDQVVTEPTANLKAGTKIRVKR
ncbi:MAG TPA: efflux RND transporter periplasmic adaptor subunit [Balneolales bacterium]|nr:efflux RND transporter periplasmic adaptor subunit [Balneolales bacterium]